MDGRTSAQIIKAVWSGIVLVFVLGKSAFYRVNGASGAHSDERLQKTEQRIPNLLRSPILAAGSALAGLVFISSASAQYSFDPNNADEKSGGIKYFGSAKDDQGALLPGVTILIGRELVLVTDEQGRYRGSVDPLYTPDITTVGCSKSGYQFVSVTKRPGPVGAAQQTVEVNCILRKIH